MDPSFLNQSFLHQSQAVDFDTAPGFAGCEWKEPAAETEPWWVTMVKG